MLILARLARTFKLPGLLGLVLAGGGAASAQGHGGPGGSGGGPGGPGHGPLNGGLNTPGPSNSRNSPPPGPSPSGASPNESTMRGGLQLGPPGRWWDNAPFARSIGIDSRQQKRMDEVFSANKPTLLKLYKNLQSEENQLEKTTHDSNLDEAQIFQQIDRITQARGELEKANAHMLLQLRREMTPEQAAKLEDHRSL